jgi:Electron transfer DM13
VLKTGSFASGEHPTQGTASVINQDGNVSLTLGQDFQTSELGPDLVVILHRSASALSETDPPAYPLNEGDYVVLAPLERFSGAQTYPIPDTVNLADYNAAGIWCRKFNATFGIAALQ